MDPSIKKAQPGAGRDHSRPLPVGQALSWARLPAEVAEKCGSWGCFVSADCLCCGLSHPWIPTPGPAPRRSCWLSQGTMAAPTRILQTQKLRPRVGACLDLQFLI